MKVARRRYPPLPRIAAGDRDALARFVAEGEPVVIEGLDRAWCDRYGVDALRARHGDEPIVAEDPAALYAHGRPEVRTTMRALCDAVRAGDRSLRWKGLDFGARELALDPPPTDAVLEDATIRRRSLWLAPAATMSSLHHDGDADNLNLQVEGQKLFVLIPPSAVREVYLQGSAESPVNPFAPDLARFPRFAACAPREALLEPGEALLLPRYWLHAVYAATPSVNVTTWFTSEGTRSVWSTLAGAPLAHRTLSSVAAGLRRRGYLRALAAGRALWSRTQPPRLAPDARLPLADV